MAIVFIIMMITPLLVIRVMLWSTLRGTVQSIWTSLWIAIAGTIAFSAAMLFTIFRRSRLQRKVIEANWKVCVYCHYSLVDLPASGHCPECGEPFPKDGYASVWSKYIVDHRSKE